MTFVLHSKVHRVRATHGNHEDTAGISNIEYRQAELGEAGWMIITNVVGKDNLGVMRVVQRRGRMFVRECPWDGDTLVRERVLEW
jgi:hypothetical protein